MGEKSSTDGNVIKWRKRKKRKRKERKIRKNAIKALKQQKIDKLTYEKHRRKRWGVKHIW